MECGHAYPHARLLLSFPENKRYPGLLEFRCQGYHSNLPPSADHCLKLLQKNSPPDLKMLIFFQNINIGMGGEYGDSRLDICLWERRRQGT